MKVDDPGLLYGATVFTTLRVYHSCLDYPLTNWAAHCDRLKSSLQAFAWQLPDWQSLRCGAESLLKYYPILRITIFPDGRGLIIGRHLPDNLQQLQQFGAIATVSSPSFNRSLPLEKTGNYLAPWLARKEALKLGANETILTDRARNWLETSTGNLWGFQAGIWFTPPLSAGILPGIVRSQLLDYLRDLNFKICENPWDWDFVTSLEAIAYSNSVVELIPFHTIISDRPNATLNFDSNFASLEILRSFFTRKAL